MPSFALTTLDNNVLTAAAEFSAVLWDNYGAPRYTTSTAIADRIGSDQVDVHYAMKFLKRNGHLDAHGVVHNPAPSQEATGIFSVTEVMRNTAATPIEIPCTDKSSFDSLIEEAVQEFSASTDIGFDSLSSDYYTLEEVERLSVRPMSARELHEATKPLLDAAGQMASYLDELWSKLRGKPDCLYWANAVQARREDIWTSLATFARPVTNTDIDLVRNVLVSGLWNLEKLITSALKQLADRDIDPPPAPDSAHRHIEALRDAIEKHTPESSARTIISTVRNELSQRLEYGDTDFPFALTEKSLCGIVGDFVKAALPCTEADENALAYQFITAVGNLFGTGSFATFGADRHYPNLFQLIVGPTSAGKGQSLSAVRHCLSTVDPEWLDHVKHSAASGEALVRLVSELEDDPRMLVVLSEMSVLLNSSNREGSNLSGYLRIAYDGAPLEHNRAQKSFKASNYLLSTIGHITPQELTETMSNVDFYNGSTNRFLFAACRRSKVLPRMGKVPDFGSVVTRLSAMLNLPAAGKVDFSEEGGRTWDQWVYSLTEPTDGKLAAAVERSKPNCLRVALIYALLDESRLDDPFGGPTYIEKRHVDAAVELVNRSRESVRWFLNQPSKNSAGPDRQEISRLREAVNAAGGSLSGTQLTKLFSHKSADERNQLATQAGLKLRRTQTEGRGSPAQVWTW
jgi:hypothetical protein